MSTSGDDTLFTDIKNCYSKLCYCILLVIILTLSAGCSFQKAAILPYNTKISDDSSSDDYISPDEAIKPEEIYGSDKTGTQTSSQNSGKTVIKKNSGTDDEVSVHFINVGQADCIFIDYGDTDILIDGGNNEDGDFIVNYLNSLETDDIELIVATHPHEDHIGGLDTVIYNFDVEKIIKPDLAENTKTSRDFEEAVSSRNIPSYSPAQGETIEFGDLKFIVLNDKSKNYSDTNNYSVVLKMVYGNTAFLFTGDAEAEAEHDIINSGLDIKADVLKVAHHGSASSTTANFLKKVSPDFAVISVGTDNPYGHPDSIVINRLNLQDVAILQTNEMGTVVFTTNGKELDFTVSKEYTAVENNSGESSGEQPVTEKIPDIIISGLDKKAEIVEITNKSSVDVDLSGWYLVSVTGGQTFYFPDGFIIKAGETIKIASADGKGDIKWTDANVWNNTSSDPAELYNETGALVYRWDD